MKKKKRAILVLGPESSGTRFWTQILIKAGCFGDDGHRQKWDVTPPDNERLIVWRRSVPHAGELPRLEEMVSSLREENYEVVAYVTNRDWFCMMNSQEGKHVDELSGAFGNLQIAYPFIFKNLEKLEIPFAVISYEAILRRKSEYVNKMLEMFDLQPRVGNSELRSLVDVDDLIRDANAKYYEN